MADETNSHAITEENQDVHSPWLWSDLLSVAETTIGVTPTISVEEISLARCRSNLSHIKFWAADLRAKFLAMPDVENIRKKHGRLRNQIGKQSLGDTGQSLSLQKISLELEVLKPYLSTLQADLEEINETLTLVDLQPESFNSESVASISGERKEYPHLDQDEAVEHEFHPSMNLVEQVLKMSRIGRKYNRYDDAFKMKAVALAKKKGNRAAGRELGLNSCMISRWRNKQPEMGGTSQGETESTTDLSSNTREKRVTRVNKTPTQDATAVQETSLNKPKNRKFDVAFKLKVITMVKKKGVQEVSQELGINDSLIRRWRRTYGEMAEVNHDDSCSQEDNTERVNSTMEDDSVKHIVKESEESQQCSQDHQELQACSVEAKLSSQTPVQEVKQSAKSGWYKCHICFKYFQLKSTLVKHISKHKGQKYGCKTCGQVFEREKSLRKHQMDVHKDVFTCSLCPRRFSYAESLHEHMNEHNGIKPYECDICNEKTFSFRDLQTHKQAEHRKTFTCKVCGMKFKCQSAVDTHHHSHSEEELSKYSITLDTRVCDHCGFVTRRKYLKRHIAIKHPEFVEGDSAKHVCEICGKESMSALKHKNHVRGHFRAAYNSKGKTHSTIPGKTYLCEYCPKVYLSQSGLLMHVKFAHTNKEDYTCHVCGKQLSTKYNFEAHMRGHNGVRPFKCPHCDKTYTHRISLIDHLKYHRGEIVCKICGKQFTSTCNLTRHVRGVHARIKRFQCHYCDKSFHGKVNRDIHLNIHTGNKPFGCDECDLKFGDPSTLYKHKRRHQEKNNSLMIGLEYLH